MRFRPINSIKTAFLNLWRNATNTLGSILIMSFTFAILGIVFIIVLNINQVVKEAQGSFDEIGVFLRDDAKPSNVQTMYDDFKNIVGVSNVRYENKDVAFKRWKEEWGEDAYLLEGIGDSPLPNAFYITLKDISYTSSVADIMSKYEGIEDIKYYREEVEKMLTISRVVAQIGLGVISVLLVLSFFVVTNTIKIAVNSRHVEINIMKYVGAKNSYIRIPFIIEGVLIGALSALLSSLIVFIVYKYVLWSFGLDTNSIIEGGLIFSALDPMDLVFDFTFISTVLGIGIGALGAISSTRKHLKV